MSFIEIDKNIYDNVMPFKTSNSIFSFRNSDLKASKENTFRINICPFSLLSYLDVNGDKSFKSNGYTFENVLNEIPAIQIREYVQSPKLQQITNAFGAFVKGWNMIMNMKDTTSWGSIGAEIMRVVEKITSAESIKTFWQELLNEAKALLGAGGHQFSNTNNLDSSDVAKYILQLPFFLQYNLMSTTTQHVYVLPYDGNYIGKSDGTVGWNSKHGLGTGTVGSEQSVMGMILNFVGSNLRINTTPTWDGTNDTNSAEIQIKFNLFNDTKEAALRNFLFVNTIVPMNKYLQYHIYQHNPPVYDIKIEGVGRWYMCQGSVQCNSVGVLRNPHESMLKGPGGLKAYINETLYKSDELLNVNNKLIKIPDSYEVIINLKSLLPNSLNNYLYSYSGNMNITKQNMSTFDVTNPINTFDNVTTTFIKKIINETDAPRIQEMLKNAETLPKTAPTTASNGESQETKAEQSSNT